MAKRWMIVLGTLVVLGLVGALAAGAVFAQGGSATPTPQESGVETGALPVRVGPMDEIATLLGMTPDEIAANRVLGKTLADLAKEKSVSEQSLVDVLVSAQKTMLDQTVIANRMTQAQADKYLVWYKQAAALQLTEPYGPGGGCGGFGRGGSGSGGGMGGERGGRSGRMGGNPAPGTNATATPQ